MPMRVSSLDDSLDLASPVVTVGTFDGVHVGHRSVLGTVRREAAARSGTAVAVTFDPHPLALIDPQRAPGILTTLAEKTWCLEPVGIDVLAVASFTQDLRSLSRDAFVESYLVGRLGASAVVVGYDHRFGRDRQGDLTAMQDLGRDLGFDVISVPPTHVGGAPVSSTRIRELLSAGDLDGATRCLGGGYPLAGKVVPGDRRGRELGFPTANIALDSAGKLLPRDGVYAAWVYIPHRRPAVLNLGCRPTFDGETRSLEVHVLDYEGDLYDVALMVEFVHWIRGERQFEGREALTAQIRSDVEDARKALSQVDATLLRR